MDQKHVEELRKQYMEHPPEGMTSEDVQHMSDDDLLDDEVGAEGFYIF